MSAFWQNPIVVVVMLVWLAAPPRSLSDVSQREAVRRQMTTKSTVLLTNAGKPLEIPLVGATAPSQTAPAGAAAAAAPAGSTEVKKDETWWKNRMASAREAVDRDQAEADKLQNRINVLQRDVVNEDNPIKQGQHRQELQVALKQLELTKQRVEGGRQAVEAVQEEARRANVPAGWVR